MHLQFKIDDDIQIGEETYTVNASFDNILKVIDLIKDSNISDVIKPQAVLLLLINDELKDYSSEDKQTIITEILKSYVEFDDGVQYDLNGNPMPVPENMEEDKGAMYDFNQDAEYIYASFMQAYGIDLIDQQGQLHWFKFKALLTGLPTNTIFSQVLDIRGWSPSRDKRKYNVIMRERQKQVALKGVD